MSFGCWDTESNFQGTYKLLFAQSLISKFDYTLSLLYLCL
jgi:hypothetical protein